MEALKELLGQLAENAKQAPGWLPLLLLCYAVSYALEGSGIPWLDHLEPHRELAVSAATLILYTFGDALDKPVFKRFSPKWLDRYREQAEDTLLIKGGIYKVAKALAVQAEYYDRSWIRVKNESAKFLRSLVLPSLLVLLFSRSFLLSALAVHMALLFLFFYLQLKAWHMADLYALSQKLAGHKNYEAANLTPKTRAFFWEGELVATARRPQAIVLLHGHPFDHSMWQEQIKCLNEHGYSVIAPDLRGLGGTLNESLSFYSSAQGHHRGLMRLKKPCGELNTMEDMALDVVALMDALEIDKAAICGLSMGGYVAFEIVHACPERVNALILAGTRAAPDTEAEKEARFEQVEQMLSAGMGRIAESTLQRLLHEWTLKTKPNVVARVRQIIAQADPEGAAADQRGMAARRSYVNDLENIKVPTLIIVGRHDPIRPVSDAQFMHQLISDSRLEIIEYAAHLANMDEPKIFSRTLLTFLDSVE